MKIACVAVVRDEERYIAEWIAYQLALGFDTVLLLDNNSTDQTKPIAARFAPRHDVRVFDWPMRTRDYQLRAYEFAVRRNAHEFAWMAFFDTDEFLVLDQGATLKQRLSGLPDAAALAVSWAMFGSSGHRKSPAGLVIEDYLHRSAADFGPNIHVKSIIRPGLMRATSNPHAFEMDGPYVDLAGRALRWQSLGKIAAPPDYAGGKLHHYFTRSWSDWQAKLRRGYRDTKRPEDDFYVYDRNEVFDDGAAKLAPKLNTILSGIAAPKHRFALAACARWETPYIVEWLNYHRAIGFAHVFLYCNDDDPAELYAQVLPFTEGPAPFVTFNHHEGQGEQQQMYRHFLLNYLHQCEWVGFLDIDEFLRLPPSQTIASFIGGFDPSVDCVLFNWIFFGPNGHKTPPQGPVLANYTRRSESIHPYTKYLVKAAALMGEKILDPVAGHGFWHSLHDMLPAPIRVVNVLGEDAKNYYDGFPDQPSSIINQWDMKSRLLNTAIVHHYAFRSEQAFWDRSARGLEGAFKQQTIWRELAEGDGFAAFLDSVNATEDLHLAEFWRAHVQQGWHRRAPALPSIPAPRHGLKLGIAITTLNRCDMVLNLVEKIHELTEMDYDLVICDDGSIDATRAALLASGQVVIGGTPRGIAWNKNRGLYYLLNVVRCDVILLLDDDVVPTAAGWEAEWVEAATRYGHVNYALEPMRGQIKSGASTAADPGLSTEIPGCALAFSRVALAQLGYFDTRFGRYGNEHTDLSFRAIRAGFGGITVQEDDWKATYFCVIEGGIEMLPSISSRSQEDLDATSKMLHEFFKEPIYRHAWASDDMRDVFLSEIEAALGASDPPLRTKNHFLSWRDFRSANGAPPEEPRPAEANKNLALRKPAMQSSVDQWSAGRTPAEDAAGAVNGRVDGQRKFHTALEDNPWWQVDLGGFETIHEIRIYNTTDDTAFRFRNFSLSVSIEGDVWIEIARKEDGAVVGGITGGPYVWNGPGTAWARFVRITLLGRDFLHLDQVEVYGSPAEPSAAAAAAEATAPPPAKISVAAPFSKIPNPLGGQGFVLGWEAALLGNRLSSFANLFALSERTGIPAGYPQILACGNLFEMPERRFYVHGGLAPEQFTSLDRLAPFMEDLFRKSYEDYSRRFMTVALQDLHELNTESGIIVFSRYQPEFQDFAAVEEGLKNFCARGNGIILSGAYWHQYMDMRTLRRPGEALRHKLRISRADHVAGRASAMRDAGEETLRIGVHIRRADDYRSWIGGKYFFDFAQYAALIRRIHEDLAGRPHHFCVCSDMPVDTAALQGLPVWYYRGALEDDFVALSKCHYVVGPPSTFGTWSAFLGGAKRVVLTAERMADFSSLPPILETAVEIIYPTGGYLPGDPAMGPI